MPNRVHTINGFTSCQLDADILPDVQPITSLAKSSSKMKVKRTIAYENAPTAMPAKISRKELKPFFALLAKENVSAPAIKAPNIAIKSKFNRIMLGNTRPSVMPSAAP